MVSLLVMGKKLSLLNYYEFSTTGPLVMPLGGKERSSKLEGQCRMCVVEIHQGLSVHQSVLLTGLWN